MVPVQLRVDDADVDVSADAGRWRLHAPNRMFLRSDAHGGRLIVGIGDHGDVTGTAESSSVVQAFAAVDFDPDIAVAATRFWCWEAVQKGSSPLGGSNLDCAGIGAPGLVSLGRHPARRATALPAAGRSLCGCRR
jgi:hypothetical protein